MAATGALAYQVLEYRRGTRQRFSMPDRPASGTPSSREATGGLLAGPHVAGIESFDDGVALQVVRSTPTGGAAAATELFYAAIAGAEQRVWLTHGLLRPRPHV